MIQVLPKQCQHKPGQGMVEFALVVPVLFLLILGIIEMGYALFVYTSVQNAAREGARAAAVKPCPSSSDTTAIQSATRARLPALVDTSLITPAIVYSDPSQDFGTVVTVTVDYAFPLLDPLLQTLIPQVQVRATASRSITTGCSSAAAVVPTLTPTPIVTSTPTVTPTSTPTATPCTATVPDLTNQTTNGNPSAADTAWAAAGFSGSVVKGSNGNYAIRSQSLPPDSIQPCTASITVYDH